ncbi:hypothetical protein EDB80DRAFT_839427 [Ilyonectria destructans]|nr:hypothetical protein EDB80DRAFT_839427 [Ilyonectria destructans]
METFHSFPQFPYDIRHQVWSEALAGATHRVHALCFAGCEACASGEEGMPHTATLSPSVRPLSPLSETTMTPRRVAAVCSESRNIATALLPDTLDIRLLVDDIETRQSLPGKRGIFRFNSATDVIYFEPQLYPDCWPPCYRFKYPRASLLEFSSIINLAFDLHSFSVWKLCFLPMFSALRQLYLVLWDPKNPQFEQVFSKWEEEGAEDGKYLTGSETYPERYIVMDRTKVPRRKGRNEEDLGIFHREGTWARSCDSYIRHLSINVLLLKGSLQKDFWSY